MPKLVYISLLSQCNDISRQQRNLHGLLMFTWVTLNKYLKSLVFYRSSASEFFLKRQNKANILLKENYAFAFYKMSDINVNNPTVILKCKKREMSFIMQNHINIEVTNWKVSHLTQVSVHFSMLFLRRTQKSTLFSSKYFYFQFLLWF